MGFEIIFNAPSPYNHWATGRISPGENLQNINLRSKRSAINIECILTYKNIHFHAVMYMM